MTSRTLFGPFFVVLWLAANATSFAQTTSTTGGSNNSTPASDTPAAVPDDFVIGPDDTLSIVFWREKEMSADVVVRPDGKVSVPLLNDVQAAGLTPEQLRARLVEAASKYIENPNASVVVKDIKSRTVFITGYVTKPGTYQLLSGLNVLQLIALAGGLQEYADSKNITVMRKVDGKQRYFKFNFKEVIAEKRPEQNILLMPGDTIVVP